MSTESPKIQQKHLFILNNHTVTTIVTVTTSLQHAHDTLTSSCLCTQVDNAHKIAAITTHNDCGTFVGTKVGGSDVAETGW
jgi:hypothetical protein